MNDIPLIEPVLLPATIPSPIKTKECRFVTYVPSPEWEMPDLHVVKEVLHFEDGTTKPNLNFIYDYKRPTWVTKKGGRNHKQHKEWEYLDNLIEVPTTQTRMIQNISRALGMPGFNAHLRKLFEVPYIYGADIKSTAVLKKAYMDKYPGIQTKFSVASFDIETSMFDAEGTIIMASVSFKNKVFSIVRSDIVAGRVGWLDKVRKIAHEKFSAMQIGDKVVNLIETRKLEFEIISLDTELDILKAIFAKFHEWQPDFLAIWNMDFEMTKILEVCDRFQYDPKYLFSDPSVPDEYKYFTYKRGPSQKKTSSGKVMPIKPAARWHTVVAPASFYIVDSMCAFKHTRAGEQEEQSYSLDSILRKLFNMGKMTFPDIPSHIDQESHSADWHRYMQKNKPLEYLVYNMFDCIGPELIDEKVMDLAVLMQKFSGTSDFEDFKSQPRRVVDKLHWFGLERGKVIGVTSAKLVDEFDEETLDREDWVITLPAA